MSTARSTRVPGAIGLTSIRSRNDTWHWLQHSLVGGIIQVPFSFRANLLWECIPPRDTSVWARLAGIIVLPQRSAWSRVSRPVALLPLLLPTHPVRHVVLILCETGWAGFRV